MTLRTVCSELKIAALSEEDYEFLHEFVAVIGPIAKGITLLEGDKQLFGTYLPTLFRIQTALNEMESSGQLLHCVPLLNAVQDGFRKRFREMMDPTDVRAAPLYIAMICDPKYKLDYIPPYIWASNSLQCFKNLLLTAAEKILNVTDK